MKDVNLFKLKESFYFVEVSRKEDLVELEKYDGVLIRGSEKVARGIIASLRDREKLDVRNKKLGGKLKIGVYGGDDAFNRRVIETLRIDYLVSPEADTSREIRGNKLDIRKDGLHRSVNPKLRRDGVKQRDSGLNHVVAKLAKEKGVGIVVNMSDINGLMSRRQVAGGRLRAARRIARIMQNVLVCRKAGVKVLIGSFGRSKGEVVDLKSRQSFGETLGMSSQEVRDSVKF